jgi:Tol biopolymer transport system component
MDKRVSMDRRSSRLHRLSGLLGVIALVACGTSPRSPVASSSVPEIPATAPSPSSSAEAASTPSATIDISVLTGRIAFSGGPPHAEDVYVVDADGTGLRKVTNDSAAEFDPTWSPDGTRIAYRHQAADDRSTDIYVIGADGSGARNVSGDDGTADWGPAWSPDGTWIAWNTSADRARGFDLGLVHADGTGRAVVAPGVFVEYPAWSPDGSRIAFMSQVADEGSQYDVFVMDSDGSDVKRLTTTSSGDGWPTWSPDGSSIAFSSTRDDCGESSAPDCLATGDLGPYHTLYVMATDGSGQRRVSTLFAQIADWSPDGRYLAFEGRSGLTVVSADGAEVGAIPLDVGAAGFPDWIK